jgi:hypothetical protein
VLGLAIYYTPYVIYTVRSIKGWLANKADAIVPMSIMLAFFLGDLGGVSYFNRIYHVFVGLAIGLLIKQSREPAVERANRESGVQ